MTVTVLAATPRQPTEERRAGIVAALLALARERSPALITTGDVASALGVTQGAVFKHFATKEAIWVAAMQWVRVELLQRLEVATRGALSPLAALTAMFHAHVAFVTEHPGVPRMIFHELQQPADTPVKHEVRQLLQAYHQRLRGGLAGAQAQGELRADLDLEAAATLFIGIVQGLVMQALLSGDPAQMPAHAERVFSIYLRGLREPS